MFEDDIPDDETPDDFDPDSVIERWNEINRDGCAVPREGGTDE